MARERLPAERRGLTKRIHLRYATEHGPEDRTGSTISGLLDALSITASLALQSGVPVETIVEKWARLQFAPSGTTTDPELPRVSSIVDAVARWLRLRYCQQTP